MIAFLTSSSILPILRCFLTAPQALVTMPKSQLDNGDEHQHDDRYAFATHCILMNGAA